MGQIKDKMQEFEDKNWSDLAEKFIERKWDDWCQFVYDEYEKSVDYEPPDHWNEDR